MDHVSSPMRMSQIGARLTSGCTRGLLRRLRKAVVLFSVFSLFAEPAFAATTIGLNVSTGGTLTVGSTASFQGTVSVTDGNIVDLSAIQQTASTDEGLRLPVVSAQNQTPTTGSGYLAWSTASSSLMYYDGAAWISVATTTSSGSSYTGDSTFNLYPNTNRAYSLGTHALSWNNLYASGTASVGEGILTPSLDRITAGTLSIGTATSTAITIGYSTATTTFPGGVVLAGTGGSVGIGIASPSTKLEVVGTVSSTAIVTGDIDPRTNDLSDLGSFGTAWKDVYASGTSYLGNIVLSGTCTGSGCGSNYIGASAFDLRPTTNNTYDLGYATSSWNNLYVSGTIYSGGSIIPTGPWLSLGGGEAWDSLVVNNIDRATFGTMNIGADMTDALNLSKSGVTTTIGGFTQVAGRIVPDTNNSYDLGLAPFAFRNLYASGTSYLGNIVLSGTCTGSGCGSNYIGASAFDLRPTTNDTYDLGYATSSWKDIYSSGTAYLTNAKVRTSLNPAANNSVDLGSFGTAWKDVYASGTIYSGTGAEMTGTTLILAKASGFNTGRFYVDSSGNVNASGTFRTASNIFASGNLSASGSLNVTGNVTSTGNIYAQRGVVVSGNVTSTGSMYPSANNSADLGAYANAWKDIFASGTSYLGNIVLSGTCTGCGGFTGAASNDIFPTSNNAYNFGYATSSWKDVYVSGTMVVASGSLYVSGSSGNVGVGVSSPSERLDVQGNIENIINATSSIRQVGSVGLTVNGIGVDVSGNIAYVVGNGLLRTYDVSNPSSIALLGSSAYTGNGYAIHVQGRYAYIANGLGNDLLIYDISNPSTPTNVATLDLGAETRGVFVSGKYAFVANYGGNSLDIVNISDPIHPQLAKRMSAISSAPRNVYVLGRYAYLASWTSGNLKIIDLSDVENAMVVGTIALGTNTHDVHVTGRYAYVTNYGSDNLSIVDVKDPAAPLSVATSTFAATDGPSDIIVNGRYAYVTNYDSGTFSVLDISNPASPVLIAKPSDSAGVWGIDAAGRNLYMTSWTGSDLKIFDTSGIETTALYAHSAEVGSITVQDNMDVMNQVSIGGGLNIGQGGIYSIGSLAIGSTNTTSTFGYSVSSTYSEVSNLLDVGQVFELGRTSTRRAGAFRIDSAGNASTSGSVRVYGNVTSTGSMYPSANNSADLGAYGTAWKDIFSSGTAYLTNASIATSFKPTSNNTADLGSYGNAWKDIYASGTLYIGSTSVLDSNSFKVGTADSFLAGRFYVDSSGNVNASGSIRVAGGVNPSQHNAADLGAYGNAWKDMYVSGTIHSSGQTVLNGATSTYAGFADNGGAARIAQWSQFVSQPKILSTSTIAAGTVNDMAFDGRYVWIADAGGSVVKYDPVGRQTVTTLSLGGGTFPFSVMFDGTWVWVTTQDGYLHQINPNIDAVVTSLPIGGWPRSMAYDGRNIWIPNSSTNVINKVDPVTVTVVATTTVGSWPSFIAFDGRYVWTANNSSDNVSKVDTFTGDRVATISTGAGSNPYGITFDGSYIWVANTAAGYRNVLKIDPQTNAVIATVKANNDTDPYSFAFDGRSLWLVGYGTVTSTVNKINPVTNKVTATTTVGSGATFGMFDGSSLWVTSGNGGLTQIADPQVAEFAGLRIDTSSTMGAVINQSSWYNPVLRVVSTGTQYNSTVLQLDTFVSAATNFDFISARTSVYGVVTNPVFRVRGDGQIFSDAGTTITQPADLAELTTVKAPFEDYPDGTIVAQSDEDEIAEVADSPSDPFLGIATDRGAFMGSGRWGRDIGNSTGTIKDFEREHSVRRIAVSGYIMIRVNDENGPIRPGDALALSSTPGEARKALPGDFVIGMSRAHFPPKQETNLPGEGGAMAEVTSGGASTTFEDVLDKHEKSKEKREAKAEEEEPTVGDTETDGSDTATSTVEAVMLESATVHGVVESVIGNGAGVSMGNVLQAQGRAVSADGSIDAGAATILTSSGTNDIAQLVVRDVASFHGELRVKGHAYWNEDMAGLAKILVNSREVKVTFGEPYEVKPVVTVTPETKVIGEYWVETISPEGFTIRMSQLQANPVIFDWHALAVKERQLFVSDGTHGDASEEYIWGTGAREATTVDPEDGGSGSPSEPAVDAQAILDEGSASAAGDSIIEASPAGDSASGDGQASGSAGDGAEAIGGLHPDVTGFDAVGGSDEGIEDRLIVPFLAYTRA